MVGMVVTGELAMCAEAAGLAPERVRELADFARDRGEALIDVLVQRGNVEEQDLLKGLASQLNLPFQGQEVKVPPEILSKISPALAIRHHVIPLGEDDGKLRLGCADPFDWRLWDDLCHVVGRPLQRVLCPKPLIAKMLKASYGIGADTVQRLLA